MNPSEREEYLDILRRQQEDWEQYRAQRRLLRQSLSAQRRRIAAQNLSATAQARIACGLSRKKLAQLCVPITQALPIPPLREYKIRRLEMRPIRRAPDAQIVLIMEKVLDKYRADHPETRAAIAPIQRETLVNPRPKHRLEWNQWRSRRKKNRPPPPPRAGRPPERAAIVQMRRQLGWSQVKLARAMGGSHRMMVWRIENSPSSTLEPIAQLALKTLREALGYLNTHHAINAPRPTPSNAMIPLCIDPPAPHTAPVLTPINANIPIIIDPPVITNSDTVNPVGTSHG